MCAEKDPKLLSFIHLRLGTVESIKEAFDEAEKEYLNVRGVPLVLMTLLASSDAEAGFSAFFT